MTESNHEATMRPAKPSDWEQLAALLTVARLPLAGAKESLSGFVLAFRGEELAGSAGLERYGADALLRSVAVAEAERGRGLGVALVQALLAKAAGEGVANIVLLTETAESFFARLGFRRIPREDAPASVRASVEFQSVCPQSAAVMILAPRPSTAEAPQ
jgi:amino-acid N-acetyltransferase